MDGQPTDQSNNNSKHKWDKQEDEKLIECLLQLSESGNWRADNGTFRSGFLQQLERWMHEKIPNCQVRATPHISSRVKLWKKQYYALSEMLGPSASGFEKAPLCPHFNISKYSSFKQNNIQAQVECENVRHFSVILCM